MEYENPLSFYIEIKNKSQANQTLGNFGIGITSVQRSKLRETANMDCGSKSMLCCSLINKKYSEPECK